MADWQEGIVAEDRRYAAILTLSVRDPVRNGFAVAKACGEIPARVRVLAGIDPAAGLWANVGFGADFWDALSPGRRPKRFQPLEPRKVGGRVLPRTGGEILFHISSERVDLNFELSRRLIADLGSAAEVMEEVTAFRYLDNRDLTGFIDGTANPQGEERAQVALIGEEDPHFRGGSFVLAQRYVHDLEKWAQLSQAEQEKAIGRTKPDSRELSDEEKPPTAHISRVEIEEEGEELQIVRHSMPYGRAGGEAGLIFIAYARDAAIFNAMLGRMFGADPDGLHDRLMDYTRPVSGEIFFVPPPAVLRSLAG